MNPVGVKTWTDVQDQMLRTLHAQGLSFSQIGAEMGITRGAVSGRADRIGLPMRKEQSPRTGRPKKIKIGAERRRKVERQAAFKPKLNAMPASKVVEEPPRPRKPLVELEPGECRWPYRDANFTFCALPAVDGQPYCGPHCRAAYHVARPIGERAQARMSRLGHWAASKVEG